MKKPNALNYLATWEYVKDFDIWAQQHRSGYSKRNFAKWAKVQSPNFISLLISKKRALKSDWLDKFILTSQMAANEAAHFRRLSDFENAKSTSEREKLFIEIRTKLNHESGANFILGQLEILTKPELWILYHMLDLSDQQSTSLWFKHRLRFLKMNGAQIDDGLKALQKLGLVQKENEVYQSKEKQLTSPDQIKAQSNAIYHKHILQESQSALDLLTPDERAFGSMTATVANEKISDLKKEINKFGQYLMSKYASKEPVDGEVFRINIQLYPLTKKRTTKED